MNLPNYFLADLPPEATLTSTIVGDACQTLKRNREQYLAGRSTRSIIELLVSVAEGWLRPDSAFRNLALDQGPAVTGFSRPTLARGLDDFFKQLTADRFNEFIVQELGHARRLDQIVAIGGPGSRGSIARGPGFMVHIAAGNIPNAVFTGIVLGLLTRSAQFVKCPSSAGAASFLPRLFAHSIYDADSKLGACLEVAEWRGGDAGIETVLFQEADCVAASGADETLASIRSRLPGRVRFVGYGHRISFAYVAARALAGSQAGGVAARAASDVTAWNQLGCLSPHVIYVDHGAGLAPEAFAALLAGELEKRETAEPRGAVPPETAATIASRRAFYEVRAAHSPDTQFWQSRGSTAWTVVYEADPRFQMSCLHRFIYVKGVKDLKTALEGADDVRGKVSTVGLAAPEDQVMELAGSLAAWGATRICPLGQMQNPPLLWRHDGRPALGDLVTWTDLEME